jgi:hypothetical protein
MFAEDYRVRGVSRTVNFVDHRHRVTSAGFTGVARLHPDDISFPREGRKGGHDPGERERHVSQNDDALHDGFFGHQIFRHEDLILRRRGVPRRDPRHVDVVCFAKPERPGYLIHRGYESRLVHSCQGGEKLRVVARRVNEHSAKQSTFT